MENPTITKYDAFTESEIATVYHVIAQRRDMRHFLTTPVEPAILSKLLAAAHHAPSVGLMQPWRFIRITDLSLRKKIYEQVQEERLNTANALDLNESAERESEFMRLKVEGSVRRCWWLPYVTIVKHMFLAVVRYQ